MDHHETLRTILGETLHLEERAKTLKSDTPLLGHLPELDSMAVVEVVAPTRPITIGLAKSLAVRESVP